VGRIPNRRVDMLPKARIRWRIPCQPLSLSSTLDCYFHYWRFIRRVFSLHLPPATIHTLGVSTNVSETVGAQGMVAGAGDGENTPGRCVSWKRS
jgi:hypothetical protein